MASAREQLERKLTYDERATRGTCPVCGMSDGEWCLPMGPTLSGSYPDRGVHLVRLQNAPRRLVAE